MKALEFAVWLRDDVGVIRHSKEGDRLKPPSNGELRRWVNSGAIQINGQTLSIQGVAEWPITNLVLFPNNRKSRCTII